MFLEDPSVLTKDKLKSELLANNVALPTGEHKKDVYVQLYLKNLTVQNRRSGGAPDAFSSDEDLPPPVVTNRSRSGRKATRKTDKPRPDEVDVSELTDEDLKDQLLKYGISVGPIVEEQVEAEPELEPEPEPVPVVEKRVRSRGKTPVSLRARRLETNRVEQRLTAGDQTPRVDGKDILKEMFPNEVSTPTGISATCRRPIRGAAGRPLTPSDFWLDEKLLRRTERVETTSYEESCSIPRLSAPRMSAPLSSSSRAAGGTVAPPAGQVCSRRSFPVWVQLVLLSIVAGFLFFVYQAMETNQLNPFGQESASVAQSGSTGESTSK
ncbi:Lamina-associated polypeptide 2-like [Scleropages formosus]|uniref:Lamina-associated polypeptide 2-like n=1 Tax=Scleropages formosus TaxID=113540 RepID=A0A0N8K186_SCLFO|nr:Lamina-associated polypeptide 2-like [Scleropages formosus]